MDPLEKVLYLQSNWNSVTECLALSMGVSSPKSFHCVGAGLFSRLPIHLVCRPELLTCGHVHSVLEVHSVKYFHVHVLDRPVLLS